MVVMLIVGMGREGREPANNNSEITENYDFLKPITVVLENSCSKLSKSFKENIYGRVHF